MSALRILVLTVVLAAGLSLGETSGSCATPSSTQRLYGNTTVTCSAGVACQTTLCSCVGASRDTSTGSCTWNSTMQYCSTAMTCATAFIDCMNKAATESTCTGLNDLKVSLMAIDAGKLYNESLAYSSCKWRACSIVNASAGPNCTLYYNDMCKPTVAYQGTLILQGDFTTILQNAEQSEQLAVSIETDLKRTLRLTRILVTRLYVRGTYPLPAARTESPGSRRQSTSQQLIVEFTAQGVSQNNANFAQQLEVVKADGNWLTSTSSTYSTLSSGGSLTFLGAATGTGSAAIPANITTAVPTPANGTSAPGETPTPGTTTLAPGTTATPGTTNTTPAPTTTGVSGVQTLVAAVLVAVLTTLLL